MAVVINGNSGSSVHGEALTLTGTGFGTKSSAAPVVWDNCDHPVNDPAQITAAGWSGAWPDAGTAAYRMQYRNTNFRSGMGTPHSRVGKYMAGAHGDNVAYNQGYNVIAFKSRTVGAYPFYTYASWYFRCDDNWVFGLDNGDCNHKLYDWSSDPDPMSIDTIYDEYGDRPTSPSAQVSYHIFDDGDNTDEPQGNWWGDNGTNPMAGAWIKAERYLKWSSTADGGLWKIVENGVTKYNVVQRTDTMAGSTRSDGLGGFSRDSGNGNNYRYFADLYLDYTWQHVCLGDASTLAACTKLEVCKPTAWNDTSLTVEVNRGAHSDGATVYAYVYDATGTPNSNGFEVTADGDPPVLTRMTPRIIPGAVWAG